MLHEHHLLVTVDGSQLSPWTLRRARRLFGSLGSTVTLLRVIECTEEQANSLSYRADSRHQGALRNLAELRAGITGTGAVIRAKLRFGDPATEILREIAGSRQDYVVMSTHARVGLAGVFLGGVTERVLRASPVPLLLFRPLLGSGEALSPVEDFSPAWFEQLLVGLDGSATAEEVLPATLDLARALGTTLHLFRAVPAEAQEPRLREAEAYLRGMEKLLVAEGIPGRAWIRRGGAASEALELIRAQKLDSVALTTHGHTGIARSIYGSVAWELVRESGVPLLLLTDRAARLPLPAPAAIPRHVFVGG